MKRLGLIGFYFLSTVSFAAGFGVAGESPTLPQALTSPATTTASTAANSNDMPANTALGNTGVSQQAFATTVRSMMPLSPDQIRALRQLFDESQRAAAQDPGVPPKPTSSSIIVNMSPGATPPIIRLRAGFVTSLVFLDSTGQAWPIKAYDLGDPQSFNIQWDQKGNTLMVQALSTYKPGNLAIMLTGQDTPIMLTLMPGQRAVDYRVDLRAPGLGPNASTQFSGLPESASPQLLDFLDGVAPPEAKVLTVEGGPAQVWLYQSHLYIRTLLTVVSPGWLSSMSSPDGTHVFELVKSPIVLASYRGQMVKLQIQGL